MWQILIIFILSFSYIECNEDIKTTIACEGNSLTIECMTGEAILVKNANYGRTADGQTCPHPSISNKNCHAANSLNIVNSTCNNKQKCVVQASNGVFGDPCVGTYKYLTVEYECIPDIKTTIACEGNSLTMECKTGEVILVKNANYGRTADGQICPHPSISNKNCHAANSLNIVNSTCNNKQKCVIQASNGVFGDPCVGTYKYLTVEYECIPDVKTTTACEGNSLTMECKTGEVILIKNANYGRTDGHTCPHPSISDKNCHAGNSLNIVNSTCNNKQKCVVQASNGVFGDPCVGTYKYLTVEYDCISALPCKADEFQCNNGLCIKESLVSNGFRDCPNGEDELGKGIRTYFHFTST